MSSPLTPIPAAIEATTDAAAQPITAHRSAQSDATPDAAASQVGAGGIAALFSAVERIACQNKAPPSAAESGDRGVAFLGKGLLSKTEDHFGPTGPVTPNKASLSQVQQDNSQESVTHVALASLATGVNSSGFVDAVIPRRRGGEKQVVLTRDMLESYYHESLDTVTERLGLSKTTIKAACRRLGLEKWPYKHSGPRKRRMGVVKPDQHAAESANERALKDTFNEIMGKRQRVGDAQLSPTATLGLPITALPGTTLADLQAMQMQSLSALSIMVASLNASDQHLPPNASFQEPAFNAPFLALAPVQPPSVLLGGNFGGNYGGNTYMREGFGGFQPWGAPSNAYGFPPY
jgi:hypothetical protein